MRVQENDRTPRTEHGRTAARTLAGGGTPLRGPMALQAVAGNAAVVQMLRQAGHPWAQEQHQHSPGCGHHQAEQAQQPAVQRVPAPTELSVQRLTVEDAPSSWHGQAVRRSGEGADGVFFVGPPGAEVVVKPLSSTGNVEYAHRFLEHMDIRAPRIVRHAVASREGQAIHDLLMNNQAVGRTPEEIPNQLGTAQAFLVMETAPGATLQGMDANAALQFLGDEAALRQTGRTMVADAFLGNDDRVVGGRVNLGNFLYQAATAIAPTTRLTAIDNNSRFTAPQVLPTRAGGKKLDDRLAVKLGYLGMLRDPARSNAFIARFLQRFRQAHHNSPEITGILDDDAQSGPVKDRLGEGITSAFADLATVFTDNVFLLRAIGSGYDEASAEDRSVSGAKATAKYVSDTQKGLTHDQAVDQLIGYVERRCAKDKLPTGLKWMGQLVA
ncbi:hypothetical protein [Streptomyces sp. NPDC006510]|uniref:hypothetical protein n=1 Tax=Streptomyces sp. NPDC006510 TaxID=3155600 RepID=UPI0033B00379